MIVEKSSDPEGPITVYTGSPEESFELGEKIGGDLAGGEVLLLTGGLGAGKTLVTKGILSALDFDVDEVTSPSFALVNLYRAKFDVYHIDLWRIDETVDAATAVGLHDLLENEKAVFVIEWAEKLKNIDLGPKVIRVTIQGDGDDPREITIEHLPLTAASLAENAAVKNNN
jgi:tRNA threonylcarbamoyladenosine biosynthesis protein TsaE